MHRSEVEVSMRVGVEVGVFSVLAATAEAEGEIEAVIPQVVLLGYQVLHGKIVVDLPPLQNHSPRADLVKEEEVVADADQGAPEALQQVQEEPFLLGIQVGRGLVQNENLRVHGKNGGQGGPLLLAVAQMVGSLVAEGLETDGLQGLSSPELPLIRGQPLVVGAESDVFVQGVAKKLIVRILVQKAYLEARSRQVLPFQGGSLKENLSALRPKEPVQMLDQRGLSGAIMANEGQTVAGVDPEIDGIQGRAACRVTKAQPLHFDEGRDPWVGCR